MNNQTRSMRASITPVSTLCTLCTICLLLSAVANPASATLYNMSFASDNNDIYTATLTGTSAPGGIIVNDGVSIYKNSTLWGNNLYSLTYSNDKWSTDDAFVGFNQQDNNFLFSVNHAPIGFAESVYVYDVSAITPNTTQIRENGVGTDLINIQTWSLTPVTSVPIPAAVWLFGTGLVGLISMRKKPLIVSESLT